MPNIPERKTLHKKPNIKPIITPYTILTILYILAGSEKAVTPKVAKHSFRKSERKKLSFL